MSKPRLLDLFCGAGGATKGYQLAGFHVTGVDIAPQPHYCGDEFRQANALTFPLDGYDAIHASPPCQAYSTLTSFAGKDHPSLYRQTRDRLEATRVPWVIENVPGAPSRSGVLLCGSAFGLRVRRHRIFESSLLMLGPACRHSEQGMPVGVYGHGQFYWEGGERRWRNVPRAEAEAAIGIEWMSREELSEAVPPAYTHWIGQLLLAVVQRNAA